MKYIKVSEAAEKWGLSPRRVRLLCAQNRIYGVIQKGKLYMIPENTPKPIDARTLKGIKMPKNLSPLLLKIDALKADLDSKRPLTAGEADRLREQFMIDFTYNSNAIEGNTLTLKETAMVLEGMTVDRKPLKDHLEAVGHRDAFLYVEDIAEDTKITESVVKNIHSLVLMDRPDDEGTYRKIPVTIMGAYTEPVQPYMIEPKMTELLAENEKRKKKMHTIERIARFHLEFEGIHHYIDGNGSCGTMAELVAEYVIERMEQYLEILK